MDLVVHPKAEREFDRQAGVLLSKILLLCVAIFIGAMLINLAFELRHHPRGRWVEADIAGKMLRYSEAKLKKTASGWGATPAMIDSSFGRKP